MTEMGEQRQTLHLPANLEQLAGAVAFVHTQAQAVGLPERRLMQVELATEEVLVNICSYAYADGAGQLTLTAQRRPDGLLLEIADAGAPFDPLAAPEADTLASIDDRAIGGLGIHLVKQVADDVSYRRENGLNVLRILFKTHIR